MVDLSFTQGPKWQELREEQWKPTGKELKGSFSKEYIASIKSYFMTGILPESASFSDGARLYYFPLKNPEGWDHVLENLVVSSDFLKPAIDKAFLEIASFEFSDEEELAYWDYFLPETFEHTYKTRVSVAGNPTVEITLDCYDMFLRFIKVVETYLSSDTDEDWPLIFQRVNYFWSLFPHISDDCFETDDTYSDHGNTVYFLNELFIHITENIEVIDTLSNVQTKAKFLVIVEEKLDELYPQLCPKLQVLWDGTKAKKAALTK